MPMLAEYEGGAGREFDPGSSDMMDMERGSEERMRVNIATFDN